MAYSGQEIIKGVLEKYPQQGMPVIRNCTDLSIEENIRLVNQYIIGVTERDSFSGGIRPYKYQVKAQLSRVTPHVNCLAWMFQGDEIDELQAALQEVADYFEVGIDIDQLFARRRVRKDSGTAYYLVVTVVQYPVIFIDGN